MAAEKSPRLQSVQIRIVVVDDHPVMRKGLVELLTESPELSVCGEAGSIADALALVDRSHPDVAVVDLSLGPESGLDLVSALAASYPRVRVLVLSGLDERLYADRALKAGALGYITKDQSGLELLAAVRRVAAGRSYVSADTAERILSTLGAPRRANTHAAPLERLSDRERHVLRLVGQGFATREIAAQLRLSIKTIESHYQHIKQKLGLRNARELTRLAVTYDVSRPPD